MAAPVIPAGIMFFKERMPERQKFVLCIAFAVVFQFTGGIYLALVSHVSGGLSLMHEDIMMAGYASFVGMTMVFPVLFRFKFRFTTRTALLVICPGLVLCNILAIFTDNLFFLVLICFVAGVFRMWGTFECLSNVQLSITPTRNFAVFFPVVYLIVLGSIQMSGMLAVYISYWANWHYMHLFMSLVLLTVWLCVLLFTRHFRFMKPLPLYGIDWLGGVLWCIFLLSSIFVFEYGEYYDWFFSPEMRIAAVIAAVSLLFGIRRMNSRRHPYIEKEVFRYRNTFVLLLLFMLAYFLLTTPNILQNMYTGILGYDMLNTVDLNIWNMAGTVAGCLAAYYWHARRSGSYKVSIFAGFFLLVSYQVFMYFMIYPEMNIERLYLPTFLRGAGYIIIYISLTVYVSAIVPFRHFFQFLCLLGFVRTGIASPFWTAVIDSIMKYVSGENYLSAISSFDAVENVGLADAGVVYQELMKETALLTLRDMYAAVSVAGIVILLVILSYRYVKGRIPGSLPSVLSLWKMSAREASEHLK